MNGLLFEVQAKEQNHLPDDWHWFRLECFPHGGPRCLYVEVEGAVAPLLTRGKNAGHPNWKKMDKTTRRTIVIPVDEHEGWLLEWERRTGKCPQCLGRGKETASVHYLTGATYQACGKCGGSGSSLAKAARA